MSLNLTAEETKSLLGFLDRASYNGLKESQQALALAKKLVEYITPRPVPPGAPAAQLEAV